MPGVLFRSDTSRRSRIDRPANSRTSRLEDRTRSGLDYKAGMTSFFTNRAGFTLIELLAAMAVLTLLVLMMARILSDSSGAMNRGQRRMETVSSGRAILDIVARDLSQALTGSNVTFRIVSTNAAFRNGLHAYAVPSDEIYFVAAGREVAGSPRSANQIAYFVDVMMNRQKGHTESNLFSLVRYSPTNLYSAIAQTNAAYQNPAWWTNSLPDSELPTVADYVVAFNVLAFDGNEQPVEEYDSLSYSNQLPLWVDLSLEMLAPADARQVALVWASDTNLARDLINRTTRRYTSRVFFPNRERTKMMP